MKDIEIEIREEQPGDYAAIHRVHVLAFSGNPEAPEARVVELLRRSGNAPMALVAVSHGQVVGHILFSPVRVGNAPANLRGLGLAPLGVLPEFQNRGIGSRLIREGLEACKRSGYDFVVVLGHAGYYPRFGFSRARDYRLENEYNADETFMAMELRNGVLQGVGGLVQYAAEFREAGC